MEALSMDLATVMSQLEQFADESTKQIYLRHGAREPLFGVKIGDLKTLVKKIKNNHVLSLKLFDTGVSDAMYLAGLIADENTISADTLRDWAKKAYWYMLSEYAVAGVAADSPHGVMLAREWIESPEERIASAGWATWSGLLSLKPDQLDNTEIAALLNRVRDRMHTAPDRVRYTMNGFIISTGTYMPSLRDQALQTAREIGLVSVDMGGTACKVPSAVQYIEKIMQSSRPVKTRKTARC